MSTRRTAVLAALTVATLTALTAQQAGAATKPVKPITSTFYLHGTNTLGEQDHTLLTGSPLPMNKTKPSGSTDKGKLLMDYVAGPNTQCTANGAFAVWVGDTVGTLTGKVTVTFFTQNNPGALVDVRLFVDGDADLCTSDTGTAEYPGATAEKLGYALPATGGKTTLTFPVTAKGKAAMAHGTLVLEISPTHLPAPKGIYPEATRVLYDSTVSPSSVTFTCTPKAGKKTC
jgi:hypothetical protein